MVRGTTEPISSIADVITSPVDKLTLPDEIPVSLCNYTDVYYNSLITGQMDFMNATAKQSEIDRFSLKQNDVVITKDSETPDDIGVPAYVESVKENLLCGYHLAILRPRKGVSGKYLSYALTFPRTRYDFYRYANGITRFGLTLDTYNKVSVYLPPLAEQKAIVNILEKWDTAIEKTEALIEKKEKRFEWLVSRFTNNLEYGRARLSDFALEVSKRNSKSKESRVLSVTNHSGFVLPEYQFEKRVASADLSNYKIVSKGEYAYNPSRINVGSIARLDDWAVGVLSPMYTVFKLNRDVVESDYFLHWLSSNEAKQRIKNRAQGSVRETVSFEDFGSIPIALPNIQTQKKIARQFNTARKEVDILGKLVEHYRKQKQGLMQKLLTGEWRVKE